MKYTQTIKSTLMSNKENIYALKPDFINFLYNDYIENYFLDFSVSDFLFLSRIWHFTLLFGQNKAAVCKKDSHI